MLVVVLAAGCRIGFDPVDDDGVTSVTPVPGATDVVPAALALTRDGATVVVGSVDSGFGLDWAIVKIDRAGRLDPRFGTGGITMIDLGSEQDLASAVAIGPGGEIIVVGETFRGATGHDSAVARLRPDGSLDPTFADEGRLIWPLSTTHTLDDRARAITVDSFGRIVVAGYRNTGYPGWEDTYVARLTPEGDPDATFGTNGVVTSNAGGNEFPRWVALDALDRIVVGLACSFDACLVRHGPDGAPDVTFGGGGAVVLDLGGIDEALDFALQPDGKILVVGSTHSPDRKIAVARVDAVGTFDPTFGVTGVVTVDLGPGEEEARAIAFGPDESIYLAGGSHSGTSSALAIVRLDRDGRRDPTFGGTHPLDPGGSEGHDLAIDTSGRLVVLARASNRFVVVRHDPDLAWPMLQIASTVVLPFAPPDPSAPDRALTDRELLDGGSMSRLQPLKLSRVTVAGSVRAGPGSPSIFIAATEITWTAGSTLSADGNHGGSPTTTMAGAGGAGASGGGGGSIPFNGSAGFGGRFGQDGGSIGGTGGHGFARDYAAGFFYGVGGAGGRGQGCCPPMVPGGEAGNGGGGGGGGSWNNTYTAGGGGGGGLVVLVTDRMSGPGMVRARGGGTYGGGGVSPGGGGGGVIWIAARSYDGALTIDVSGGFTSVFEPGEAGTARIFQILPDGTLFERAFADVW